MQADLEILKPHMDDIFFKLSIFAEVYSFVSLFLNVLFFLANKNDLDDRAIYSDQGCTWRRNGHTKIKGKESLLRWLCVGWY